MSTPWQSVEYPEQQRATDAGRTRVVLRHRGAVPLIGAHKSLFDRRLGTQVPRACLLPFVEAL
jgi:hypothetical protein